MAYTPNTAAAAVDVNWYIIFKYIGRWSSIVVVVVVMTQGGIAASWDNPTCSSTRLALTLQH